MGYNICFTTITFNQNVCVTNSYKTFPLQLQDATEVEEGIIQATSSVPSAASTSSTSLPRSTTISPKEESLSSPSPIKNVPPKHPYSDHSQNATQKVVNSPTQVLTSPPPEALPSSTAPTPVGLPIATATLIRPKALAAHSGVYTCTNTCTNSVNLTLHVLTGE